MASRQFEWSRHRRLPQRTDRGRVTYNRRIFWGDSTKFRATANVERREEVPSRSEKIMGVRFWGGRSRVWPTRLHSEVKNSTICSHIMQSMKIAHRCSVLAKEDVGREMSWAKRRKAPNQEINGCVVSKDSVVTPIISLPLAEHMDKMGR